MSDSPDNNQGNQGPEDDFEKFMSDFINNPQDMEKYADAAGLNIDPQMMQAFMAQMRGAFENSANGIDWDRAREIALTTAKSQQVPITAAEHQAVGDAFHVAAMWLADATEFADVSSTGVAINRTEWVTKSFEFWRRVSDPMCVAITKAIETAMQQQAPAEFQDAIAKSGGMVTHIAGTVFAMQLGNVIGQLSQEVITAGEFGVPVFETGTSALLIQNLQAFGKDLDIDEREVEMYMATRELAHASLFKNARWLATQIQALIASYAQDFKIDVQTIDTTELDFDPQNSQALEAAIREGAFLPPLSQRQTEALEQIETVLALVEGWVSAVTAEATVRLPKAAAITEMMARRRAAGGPAEDAFGALVGVRFRPKRLREALAMWQYIGAELGPQQRDRLWQHPDLLPTADDISNPQALVARLRAGDTQVQDDLDIELQKLLDGSDAESEDGTTGDDGGTGGASDHPDK